MENHAVLALIPARGGSKSIPRKNIKQFGPHPLLAYSIAAGLQASMVERVIVTTDDEEIADIARQYGAEVPFLRPSSLAQDDTPDLPVFTHALHWLAAQEGYQPEIVVHLRPTTPLRPPHCVDQAVAILQQNASASSVRSVVPTGENPYKMWHITPDSHLVPLLTLDGFPEPYNMPRQALPVTYWHAGHIDVIRRSTIIDQHSMTGDTILPFVIDHAYTVDIDTPLDWEWAEWLLKRGHLHLVQPESNDE